MTPRDSAIDRLTKKIDHLENLGVDITYIKKDIAEIKVSINDMRGSLVTRRELDLELAPIKKVVYGLVAVILTAVVGGILTKIIQ